MSLRDAGGVDHFPPVVFADDEPDADDDIRAGRVASFAEPPDVLLVAVEVAGGHARVRAYVSALPASRLNRHHFARSSSG
jgi:hypothetical protein